MGKNIDLTGLPVKTKIQHGKSNTRTYRSWKNMIQRCCNPKAEDYEHYGGRGITICERWQGENGFINFFSDMGERPIGNVIDRKDNDKGYYKENCKWSTFLESGRNTKRIKLTLETAIAIRLKYASGKFMQKELATEFGISKNHISQVINNKYWKESPILKVA